MAPSHSQHPVLGSGEILSMKRATSESFHGFCIGTSYHLRLTLLMERQGIEPRFPLAAQALGATSHS